MNAKEKFFVDRMNGIKEYILRMAARPEFDDRYKYAYLVGVIEAEVSTIGDSMFSFFDEE